MNHTILLTSAAVLATALTQPLEAKPHDKDGRGGGGGKAKAAMHAPPQKMAKVQKAPQAAPRSFAQRAPLQNKMASKQFAQRQQQQRVQQLRSSMAQNNHNEKENADRLRAQQRRQATIAMGGTSVRNRENIQNNDRRTIVQQNNRIQNNRFENNRFRGGNKYTINRFDNDRWRPPTHVWRDWDRRHVHVWNNHHYRWYNNDWIIIDSGYGPYYDYDYDVPTTTLSYVGSNTAMEVQEELSRRGYDPGVIDGVIGPQTRSAIMAYQQDHGLPVTGRIDSLLLREMDL